MESVTAYLGLGSNLGQREDNLARAADLLGSSHQVRVQRCSSLYETAPWGFADQPRFLNCVLEVLTPLCAWDLLELTQKTENRVGREPTFRWGPRLIDIDILLYGNEIVQLDTPDLQVPHPRLSQRAFVLVPLAELAGDAVHPLLHVSIARLTQKVEGKEGVILWGPPLRLAAN